VQGAQDWIGSARCPAQELDQLLRGRKYLRPPLRCGAAEQLSSFSVRIQQGAGAVDEKDRILNEVDELVHVTATR
jgi:hypothetical protein